MASASSPRSNLARRCTRQRRQQGTMARGGGSTWRRPGGGTLEAAAARGGARIWTCPCSALIECVVAVTSTPGLPWRRDRKLVVVRVVVVSDRTVA
jgi:hypothetical protein